MDDRVTPDSRRPALTTGKGRRIAILFLLLGAAAGISGSGAPQAPGSLLDGETAARIDAVFALYDKPDRPGCSLGILRDGRVVYSRGYGRAHLEFDAPITPETVFEAGSVSKQVTAAAIQLLAADGKLALDDDIRRYLPEVPDFGTPITIRHLLTHTSGLRDQWGLLGFAGRPTGWTVHTLEEILHLVSRQRRLNFPPGEEYLYSNTGYALLAWIVLRAGGRSLADFSRDRIFTPLGMTRTQWRRDFSAVLPGRATAYTADSSGSYRQNMSFTNVYGNGGLLTTVGDLLIWAENFWNPRILGRAALDEMETPGRLGDGTPLVYALGLGVSEYRGLRQVTHGGSTAGYRAYLVRFPEPHVAIAVLSNFAGTDAGGLAHKVADILLEDNLAPPSRQEWTALPEEKLREFAGLYRDERTDAVFRLTPREGRLAFDGLGSRGEIFPAGPGVFRSPDRTEYRFEAGTGAEPLRLRRLTAGNRPDIFTRIAPAEPAAEILAEYEGRFWSDELEVFYRVSIRDGRLTIVHPPEPAVTLEPTYRDAFAAAGGQLVRFIRDSEGSIGGFSLNAGRVRHLEFRKILGEGQPAALSRDQAPVR